MIMLYLAHRSATLTLVSCLCTLNAGTAPQLEYRVTEIPPLPGGVFSGTPLALNNQGVVVGTARNEFGVDRPFVYRDGVSTELKVGQGEGTALDINDAGEIIVQTRVVSSYANFLIRESGPIALEVAPGVALFPSSLNNRGEVAGYAFEGLRFYAVSWSNGVVRRLGLLHDRASLASDINDLGVAAGEIHPPALPGQPPPATASAALLWDGGMLLLDNVPAQGWTFGKAINNRGDLLINSGGLISFRPGCFLFTGGALVTLDPLPGDSENYGGAINNRGDVVGTSQTLQGQRAFLYMDGTMHDLNDFLKPRTDWRILQPLAINDKRQIVGIGSNQGHRGVLLTPKKKPKAD